MPAAKTSILGKLRKQGRAQGRGSLSASANSAFAALTQRNGEHATTTTALGLKHKDTDLQTQEPPLPTGLKRKRGKRGPRKVKKPQRKVTEEPETPGVECWRPAGGEQLLLAEREVKSQSSDTLEVARVATWRAPSFREGVEKLLEEERVGFAELSMEETVHGGESVTDVRVRFKDPGQAEMARGKLEGKMVGGRKLQIRLG